MTDRRPTSRDDDRRRDREDRGSRDRDDRGSRDRGGREEGRGGRDRDRGSSGSGFSYRRRTAEEMNKRSSMGGKDFDSYLRDDIKIWKPNDGANTIRILPPTWPDPTHYGYDIWVHYGVGPDNQAYLCLHKMKGEHCPICAERDRARKAGEDEQYVKDLEPTRRVLIYLIDREHEGEGVQAWAAPWTIDRDITKVSVDRKTNEVLPVDDPEEGFDVEFDRTGKGVGTKYVGVAVARRESSLGSKKWLEFAIDNPLPSVLEYHGADHIEKVFGGGGEHRSRREREEGDRDDKRDSRGGSDRDSSDSRSRGSDRGRDDGGRGRDRDDREGDRGGSRERGRSRDQEDELTWDGVHSMTTEELDALVESNPKLKDIDPNKADSDDELADWICEDLGIKKESGRRREEAKDEDSPRDRLRSMREGRRD